MRIIGIDPGYAIIGYGIVEYNNIRFKALGYGAITTPADMPFEQRLKNIYDDIITLLERYKPDCMSVERLYFNTNTTTAIDVAQARGVILLAAVQCGVRISDYTPLQVKQSITGYGRAEKRQVMEMVKSLLNLSSVPKPDDTADALALAVCHGHSAGNIFGKLTQEVKGK